MSDLRETPRARLSAIARLDPDDPADVFALRDAIVTDTHAEVRTAAILRLSHGGARTLVPYLRDAARDPSSTVREAAFVALARARDVASLPRAAEASRLDRAFRVRRAAVLFAARTSGAGALAVLAGAGRDPFWRVRVAARRAAAALDAAVDLTATEPAAPMEAAIPGLDDADPAVVTARLARVRGEIDPQALVGALGSSHLPLRRLAVEEIAARGDRATLRAVTRWLADDRVPYGPDAAEAVLARSGARGAALATELLADTRETGAGPLAWAIGAATQAPVWPRLQDLLAHEDARVRRASARRLPEAAPGRDALLGWMGRLLDDRDEETRIGAATWLARTGSRDARDLLLGLPAGAQPTPIRAILVQLAAEAHDTGALRRFMDDAHGGVRASAAGQLSALGALTAEERQDLERDPDPWVRRAVLVPGRAGAALRDPSAAVRRAALERLDDRDARRAWAASVPEMGEPDAFLRAQAASALAEVPTDDAVGALLRLARDADLGVRSAAAQALAGHAESARRLLEAGSLDPGQRIAAHTLIRLGGGAAPGPKEADPDVRRHLALLDDALAGRAPHTARESPRVPAREACGAPVRSLGRTGILVRPFGLSGAYGLAFDDFVLARERGVDLFFWEPGHRELGRFLRTSRGADAVVVSGTYHADAPSIERDADRTRKALRRDAIDVMLAFWTRSPARLDAVIDALADLRTRGIVRAVGISTHDRALAREAAERGLDVVMVRHSAAHRGAEALVFPRCSALGTGVLTFSNLCYGRMLHRTPAALSAPVTAADCYRYSLSQPGVHACIAAPRRRSELVEDLAALDAPSLDAARLAELRTHGDHVYARSKAWSAETWSAAEHPQPHEAGVAAVLPDAALSDEAILGRLEPPDPPVRRL